MRNIWPKKTKKNNDTHGKPCYQGFFFAHIGKYIPGEEHSFALDLAPAPLPSTWVVSGFDLAQLLHHGYLKLLTFSLSYHLAGSFLLSLWNRGRNVKAKREPGDPDNDWEAKARAGKPFPLRPHALFPIPESRISGFVESCSSGCKRVII